MKTLFALSFTALLAAPAAFAYTHGGPDTGYNDRLFHGHRGGGSCEMVRVSSPKEFGGRLHSCQKVSTYQGGPKTGSWTTYYNCHLSH